MAKLGAQCNCSKYNHREAYLVGLHNNSNKRQLKVAWAEHMACVTWKLWFLRNLVLVAFGFPELKLSRQVIGSHHHQNP